MTKFIKEAPIFCRVCGTALEIKSLPSTFDMYTAEEVYGAPFRVCPNGRLTYYPLHDLWQYERGKGWWNSWEES